MGALFVGIAGAVIFAVGLAFIILRNDAARLFERASKFTPMPQGASTPGAAGCAGIAFVLFGIVVVIVAIVTGLS